MEDQFVLVCWCLVASACSLCLAFVIGFRSLTETTDGPHHYDNVVQVWTFFVGFFNLISFGASIRMLLGI